MSESPVPWVEARGLNLYSGGRCLVDGLQWRCMPGERWCVIGRNAVGKTTLLRALAGLAVPQREGSVLWQGREQAGWSALSAATVRGYMPQQPQDRFPSTVTRLLDLSVCVAGRHEPRALMDQLDLGHLRGRDVMRLSGGERQRVAIAQCAVQGAPLMLLDEPAAFQDPGHQRQIAKWLVDDASGSGEPGGQVITAHDVNWIASVATHVLALDGNGEWQAGTTASMLTPEILQRVYCCSWRRVGDALLPGD
ncbi:ABC transporter ATP-binding protein [soil metagenome]